MVNLMLYLAKQNQITSFSHYQGENHVTLLVPPHSVQAILLQYMGMLLGKKKRRGR